MAGEEHDDVMKKPLFDGADDDDDADLSLRINSEFAKRFEHNARRRELERFGQLQEKGLMPKFRVERLVKEMEREKEKTEAKERKQAEREARRKYREERALQGIYEEEAESSSESGSDSEGSDESDEEVLLPDAEEEKRFLKALQRIRTRDPTIYNPEVELFEEKGEGKEAKTKKKQKKGERVYLKDVIAQQALAAAEGGGEEEGGRNQGAMTYAEEQKQLKDAFLQGVAAADGGEWDDEEGMVIKVKQKKKRTDAGHGSNADDDDDDNDGEQEVKGMVEQVLGAEQQLDPTERFLKAYLSSRKWKEDDEEEVPSYADIVGEVEEDEEELDDQDRYESEFNFRFLEPGSNQVKGYSRFIPDSVRKLPEGRRRQRQAKEQREKEEGMRRKEELKRMKNMKKAEIEEKVVKLRQVAGVKEEAKLQKMLMEGIGDDDFDPEQFDQKMKEVFGEEYYEEEDEEIMAEMESDGEREAEEESKLLMLEGEEEEGARGDGFQQLYRKLKEKEREEGVGEEGPDEEEQEGDLHGGGEGGEDGVVVSMQKAALKKSLEEYMKLDYEDVVAGVKTRFRYKQVPANRFGLKPEDILTFDDSELNQIVSLKKIAPYRSKEWELPDWQKKKIAATRKEKHQQGSKGRKEKEPSAFGRKEKKSRDNGDLSEKAKAKAVKAEVKSASGDEDAKVSSKKEAKKEKRKKITESNGEQNGEQDGKIKKRKRRGGKEGGNGVISSVEGNGAGVEVGVPVGEEGEASKPSLGKAAKKNLKRKEKRKEKVTLQSISKDRLASYGVVVGPEKRKKQKRREGEPRRTQI